MFFGDKIIQKMTKDKKQTQRKGKIIWIYIFTKFCTSLNVFRIEGEYEEYDALVVKQG